MIQADLKPLFEAKPGKTVDTIDPTVSTPVFTESNITDTSFEITYAKATDNEPDSELEYFLFTSLTDNLNNKNTIESNGTLQDQGTDVAILQATGLTPEQQYYRNVLVKDQAGNKAIYTAGTITTIAPTAGGEDSQAGDEAWAEALSASVTGLDATWDGTIDFDTQVPTGLTVVGGRVSEIDLRYEGLGGDLDISEWGNLKQCTLINLAHNSFDTDYPNAIHNIGASLEYLYLCYSDHSTPFVSTDHPHEHVATETPATLDPGKDSGTGNNQIHGSVDDTIDQLTNLKYFVLNYTDDFGENGRTPNNINGIESISSNLWNITTLEVVSIYDNWNIAHSGNIFSFPDTIGHITNLQQVFLGGGTGSTWDEDTEGFMTGTYPSDFGDLTTMTALWTERNADLSGFPDLQNSLGLVSLIIMFTDMLGTLPGWVLDGRLTELDSLSFAFPTGTGMTGELPPISTDITKLDNFSPTKHNFTGAVPVGLWDIDPNKINLGENNFTSLGRTDLSGLVSMSTMRWYRNDVEGEQIPDLDWSRGIASLSTQFNQIRFEENRYVPRDMLGIPAGQSETRLDLYKQITLSVFSYGNQKPAGDSNSYSPNTGNNLTISDFNSTYSHADNVYQWQRNGANISNGAKYSGIDTKELTITNCQSSDDGTYELVVTNPGIPGETFKSQPITVTVN